MSVAGIRQIVSEIQTMHLRSKLSLIPFSPAKERFMASPLSAFYKQTFLLHSLCESHHVTWRRNLLAIKASGETSV